MTAPRNARVTQAITPERAAVHATINALTSPSCAFVPLRETCEAIAAHDQHLADRIAELEAAEAASKAREAALVELVSEAVVILDNANGVTDEVRFGYVTRAVAVLTKEPDA